MSDPAGNGLLTAFELHDFGVRVYRQRLRLECPESSGEDIDAAVDVWLRQRPGAEHGDADGVPSPRLT